MNRTADTLDALGIRSIILLYKGDIAAGSEADPCSLDNGRAKEVTTTVSPHVDLIVTSDGDGQFNCSYPDPAGRQRTVLQGASHGRILSVADLTIDRATRDVVRDRTVAFNQVITHDITPDPRTEEFVARVADKSSDTAAQESGASQPTSRVTSPPAANRRSEISSPTPNSPRPHRSERRSP